ncbi:unnamed protein product [Symbiodinium sp. CCMP2592]|nr:unnamed protein product [Symbiodinium sp. CCMP2592]
MASGSRASSWERVLVSDGAPASSGYYPELIAFSETDKKQCVDLLTKAMLLGEGDDVWTEAVATFKDRRAKYINEDLWDTVCAQFQARRAKKAGGTMADSSKRQRSTGPSAAPPGTPPAMLRDPPSWSEASVTAASPDRPRGPPPPRPVNEPRPSAAPRADVDRNVLPRDVHSLDQWGRTKIAFGKYASKNLSYKGLVELRDRESTSYIKWCIPRAKTGGEALADLAKYLSVLKDKNMLPSPPLSPEEGVLLAEERGRGHHTLVRLHEEEEGAEEEFGRQLLGASLEHDIDVLKRADLLVVDRTTFLNENHANSILRRGFSEKNLIRVTSKSFVKKKLDFKDYLKLKSKVLGTFTVAKKKILDYLPSFLEVKKMKKNNMTFRFRKEVFPFVHSSKMKSSDTMIFMSRLRTVRKVIYNSLFKKFETNSTLGISADDLGKLEETIRAVKESPEKWIYTRHAALCRLISDHFKLDFTKSDIPIKQMFRVNTLRTPDLLISADSNHLKLMEKTVTEKPASARLSEKIRFYNPMVAKLEKKGFQVTMGVVVLSISDKKILMTNNVEDMLDDHVLLEKIMEFARGVKKIEDNLKDQGNKLNKLSDSLRLSRMDQDLHRVLVLAHQAPGVLRHVLQQMKSFWNSMDIDHEMKLKVATEMMMEKKETTRLYKESTMNLDEILKALETHKSSVFSIGAMEQVKPKIKIPFYTADKSLSQLKSVTLRRLGYSKLKSNYVTFIRDMTNDDFFTKTKESKELKTKGVGLKNDHVNYMEKAVKFLSKDTKKSFSVHKRDKFKTEEMKFSYSKMYMGEGVKLKSFRVALDAV